MDTTIDNRMTRRITGTRIKATKPQLLVALLLLAGIVALLFTQEHSRRLEARIAEWAIGTVLNVGSELAHTGTYLTVGAGSHTIFTMDVSFGCSVVLLLIPFILVAAALLASGRATLRRTLPALVVGAAALLAVNAIRFVVISASTLDGGLEGFGWAHTLYGSVIVLGGLVVILVGYVFFVTRRRAAAPTKSDQ